MNKACECRGPARLGMQLLCRAVNMAQGKRLHLSFLKLKLSKAGVSLWVRDLAGAGFGGSA